MKKLFLLLSLCCISFAAWAESYTDENGVTWGYNLETQWDETTQTNVVTGAVITQCSNYGTEIVVPESIQVDENSYNVVSLNGCVFNDGRDQQSTVTSVTLPSTLKRIGWNVFNSFSSLKSLNIPEGVTSIGGDVFGSSSDLVLTLPTSLQLVESGAFRNCKTVSLPSTNPTSLGDNISSECVFDEVSYIAVPDDAIESYKSSQVWTRYAEKICGHSEIVEYTHTDDNGITWTYYYVLSSSSIRIVKAEGYNTDIVVPAELPINEQQLPVTAIEHSFSGDQDIMSVDLSKTSITTMPSFYGCLKLKTVSLPSTLETITEFTFAVCDNLQSIAVPDDAIEAYKSSQMWTQYAEKICGYSEVVEYTYTDGNDVTWTYRYVYSNSSVRIVKAEGYSTDIDAPATLPWKEQQLPVTAIECSFVGDENIVSVDLSKTSITTIPSFSGCSSLSTVLLPYTLESIGEYAFNDCDNLQSIDLSATKVKEIKSNAFNSCDNLNTIVFPATLETIGDYAFNSCRKIKSIDLSNTKLTTIGERAFMYCNELNPLSLPATLKKIGDYAFYDNYALRNLDLSMVEEIGNNAFQHASLGTADISSAKNIGSEAFNQDITFTINATTPATIKANSFSENSKFIVSSNGYDAFCSANIWKNWADNISMYTIGSDNIKWMYRYLADSNSLCITAASGYGKEVTIPGTLPYNGANVAVTQIERAFNGAEITAVTLPSSLKRIGSDAFRSTKISEIAIPTSVESIGAYAFAYCQNLANVALPSSLSVLENDVFRGCNKLKAIDLSNTAIVTIPAGLFNECNYLEEIKLPQSITSIEAYAFHCCHALKSIDLSKVETIGNYAFYSTNLNSVDLSSAKTIGNKVFTGETFFSIDNAVPATIESEAFSTIATFLVPGSAVADYKTANVWSDYASRIFASNIAKQTINVTAESNTSAVLTAIGGSANQTSVIDLKVIGTINSYDIVVLHDKMIELRYLDLSEARIVANPYCYYENYCTEDDVLGPNSFREKSRLISIKLPAEIKSIGHSAFSQCSKLSEVVIPNSVTRIEDNAFSSCHSLQFITLPNKLEYIGSYAFAWGGLKEISFPTTLTRIEWGAFQSSELETVRIPSSLQYVGGGAFQGCSNLKKVYTYTIEPTDINEETFSNFETAMLYVPVASGQNYYWDEGWKRFLNVAEFDEEYEYFYLNGDHTLDESTGAVDGTPDADLNAGSGLTVEDGVNQNMGDLNIQHDGTNGGSIIAGSEDGNIHADNLHVNINVQSGRWYFFCFPFDLKKENISMGKEGTQYIFRWYDGEERAKGNSGWKNVTEEEGSYLKAAVGYIFQCSQSDVLTISLKDVKFKKEKKYNELVASTAENLQDASWNFVGNPYLSYYDMNSVGYDAPITVWNGHTYEAIKPGDDDYHFAPFEAFFVQKPEGTNAMEFDADAQTTLKGSQEQEQVSGARSITRAINPNRRLVNIVLSNGQESDRTRIVFNNNVSMEYELDCDAAKFDAAGVPQLYTLDSRAVKYAINERPVAEGFVTLGYSVPAEGSYTLEAPRMDTPVYVKDNLTRIIHDFSKGNYEFYSEAGTFEGRFTILTESRATGIDKVGVDEEDEKIYNLNGQRVNEATGKGIYIKNNRKEVNM